MSAFLKEPDPMLLSSSRNLSTWIWLSTLVLTATGFARAQSEPPPGSSSIHAALQPFVDRQELAGVVVLVADPTRVLCVEAVGSADRASGKPMPPDALFWIGSQ